MRAGLIDTWKIGYLLAGWMGFWLLIAILRNG